MIQDGLSPTEPPRRGRPPCCSTRAHRPRALCPRGRGATARASPRPRRVARGASMPSHRCGPAPVIEQLGDKLGIRPTSASGTTRGASAPPEMAGIQCLVVRRGVRVRDEDRRRARPRRSSHTVPPWRETARSAAASAAPEWSVCGSSARPGRSARPRSPSWSRSPLMWGPRATCPPCLDRRLVERPRAHQRAEDHDDRAIDREPEPPASLPPGSSPGGPADRAADDTDLLSVAARDLVGEEQAMGERRGEPVGEAEVGVRFRQRCRDPRKRAASTIGPATYLRPLGRRPGDGDEDPEAVRGRRRGPPRLSWALGRRRARDESDVGEPRPLGHQPRLDAVGECRRTSPTSPGAAPSPTKAGRDVTGHSPAAITRELETTRAPSPRC